MNDKVILKCVYKIITQATGTEIHTVQHTCMYTDTDNNTLARCNLQGVRLVYTQFLLTTLLPIVNFFFVLTSGWSHAVGYEGFYCILIWLSSINKLSNKINEIVKF